MICLTHDRIIQEIPFALICETHEGSRWNTGKRKCLWNETFTKSEQDACVRLFRKAADWSLVHGAPEKIVMQRSTYDLWMKLGAFCAEL